MSGPNHLSVEISRSRFLGDNALEAFARIGDPL
jgi:hypothetical protein